MNRQPLLDQLADYATRWPDETDKITRFADFVRSEPDCFERALAAGHVTGSAWVVDPSGKQVLLTHHRKFDCWLQLGGHADGDPDILSVALKEAREESGIDTIECVDTHIFDLDIHRIAARKDDPEHFHYDIRYLLRTVGTIDYIVSDESHDLRWVPVVEVEQLTTEPSMLRMMQKCLTRLAK